MEGYQYEESKRSVGKNNFSSSLFQIGEYKISDLYFNKFLNRRRRNDYIKYELMLNNNNLDIERLKYIQTLYKTQIIDKMQTSYTLLKANKSEVSLKDINKLIVTNPFTDGLKTLMLAIKNEEETSKEMYEEAIEKLYHIKYYHVEAILLYSEYLKNIKDEDFEIWFKKGKDLASKHYYRYLLHRFNCLEKNIRSEYNEDDYHLPEKFDYTEIIKSMSCNINKIIYNKEKIQLFNYGY